MFRKRNGYFDKLECPELRKNKKCTILNCIFNHELELKAINSRKRSLDTDELPKPVKKPDQSDKPIVEVEKAQDTSYTIPKAINHLQIPRSDRTINVKKIANHYLSLNHDTPNKDAIEKEHEIADSSNNVEEYRARIKTLLEGDKEASVEDPKFILPKEIKLTAPATIQVRKKFIQIMIDALKKNDPNIRTPILKATEEEFKVAIECSANTYPQSIKRKIYELSNPEKFEKKSKKLTDSEYLSKLEELVIPRETLIKYGYIMNIPSAVVPENVRTCRRCNNEFKLHEQLKPIQCHYHFGKVIKKDSFNKVYECCGGIVGGETDCCEVSEHHVFYWNNPEEMQYALPFHKTSELLGVNSQSFKAVGIDCEMGFTTRGFELLRITAVDFFSGEDIIDILVRPKGDVIDLNTRWSGIAEIKEEAMNFEDLIKLLGEVIDSNTILIGHGLENDVNSMRLIHERIIDTAVLYPKHKTSPKFRFPLKYLTFKYLGRTIQSGEHDSSEDSLAAIDVVKYFINQDP